MAGFTENSGSVQPAGFQDYPVSTGGLRLNFHQTPLQKVLKYLHEEAQLTIEVEPNVEIQRMVDVCSEQPVDKQQALKLLRQALEQAGYIAIGKGNRLAVINSQEAKKHYIPLPALPCRTRAE